MTRNPPHPNPLPQERELEKAERVSSAFNQFVWKRQVQLKGTLFARLRHI